MDSPQFAWSMESDRKNVTQSAYRLQIAKDGDFSRPVYDSEKRETEQSAQIQAKGFVMEPLTGYQVRVKAWDNQGEESPGAVPQNLYPRCRRPVSGKAVSSEWKRPLTKRSPRDVYPRYIPGGKTGPERVHGFHGAGTVSPVPERRTGGR